MALCAWDNGSRPSCDSVNFPWDSEYIGKTFGHLLINSRSRYTVTMLFGFEYMGIMSDAMSYAWFVIKHLKPSREWSGLMADPAGIMMFNVFLLYWIDKHTLWLPFYATNQTIVKIWTIHQPPWPFQDLFPPPKPCTCTIAPLRKLLRTCAQGGWEMKAIVGYGVGETQPFQRGINGRHRLSCARCS